MVPAPSEILTWVLARLERDPLVNLHGHPLTLSLEAGALVMEGELASVAAKKLALELAAGTPGVEGIVDRLRVAPAVRMEDGEIRAHVLRALSEEPDLRPCGLSSRRDGKVEAIRPAHPEAGNIDVRVEDGVVTLDGEVPSLSQKRLAESETWWVPGVRDVINGLGVEPPEQDSDDEITDALRLVLERDPLLKGQAIAVRTQGRVVTLQGAVGSEQQRHAAEEDGWCLFGVDRVVNHLEVRPPA